MDGAKKLCSKKGYRERWYPTSVSEWELGLSKLLFNGKPLLTSGKVIKNIAYNLQYLEYLQQTLKELNLSSVIEAQTYKSYIIVAAGVIESLLYYLNLQTGRKDTKFINVIEKLKKNIVLGVDDSIYDDLEWIRMLRNKVHLQDLRDNLGTDYVTFSRPQYDKMKKVLKKILSNAEFDTSKKLLSLITFLDT